MRWLRRTNPGGSPWRPRGSGAAACAASGTVDAINNGLGAASRRGDAVSYIAPQAARSSAAGLQRAQPAGAQVAVEDPQRPAGQRRQRGLRHDRAPVDGGGLAQQVLQADAQRVAADQPALADGRDVDQRQAGGGDVGEDDLDDAVSTAASRSCSSRRRSIGRSRRASHAAWMLASQASSASSALPSVNKA